jgi:hypothetical protein
MHLLILAAVLAGAPSARAAACEAPRATPAGDPSPLVAQPRALRLSRLPDADLARAVRRSVEGCDFIEVTRRRVSDGAFADPGTVWIPAGRRNPSPSRTAD